ncbi:MAG: cytochrome c oxidase subunit II [Actinomycetota bacterium]|nr:cytochrome c oxidase subunit II [Actinomycetota bacterium]
MSRSGPPFAVLALGTFILSACAEGAPSTLDPAGPGARRVESLWWPMLWISVAVFAVVAVMMVFAVVRGRGRDYRLDKSHVRWGDPFIAVAGVFIPALILGAVFFLSLEELNGLTRDGRDANLTIEVVGRNWWWEARYPNGAVTANEIHIPAGEPVRLELESADVIHSFWVPRLQVKTDHIPGTTNETWIEAERPGRFRGQCAEFCGLQHANMAFYVIAESPGDFVEWVEREAASATEDFSPTARAGEGIFMNAACVGCHTVRGTEADGELGPDLTHLAARDTIAAGTMSNTPENLELMITDPQEAKPGITMPPSEFDPAELKALVAYLTELE